MLLCYNCGGNSLKIFVDAHYFDGSPQGVTTYIYELYKNIFAMDSSVEIVFGVGTPKIYEDYPDLRDISSLYFYKKHSTFSRIFFEIPLAVKGGGYDYVHSQYLLPFFVSSRRVVTIHDILFMDFPEDYPFFHRLVRSLAYKIAASRADVVTTVSNYSKVAIKRHFGVGGAYVVPCGVGFQPSDKKVSSDFVKNEFGLERYVLYVSRVEPRKNHSQLVDAFFLGEFDKDDYDLVLVGSRSIPVKSLDDSLSVLSDTQEKSIIFLEDVSSESLYHLYNAASLFVYPSKSEGFGIPPIEAAALNTPTVCSNSTAMSDFDFFGCGHVELGDSLQLVSAMRVMLSNGSNIPVLSDVVRERYSWKKSADNMLNILRGCDD